MSLITEYDATVFEGQTYSKLGGSTSITQKEMYDAQQAWCNGLVAVSTAYGPSSNVVAMKAAAMLMISNLYDYQTPDGGNVFFRPTLAYGAGTFRPSYDSALSYFIGANLVWPSPAIPPPAYASDTGFARNLWTTATFTNDGGSPYFLYQIYGNIGISMGNVTLTNATGPITVDKVFIFRKDASGALRIVLHKSALSNPATVAPYP